MKFTNPFNNFAKRAFLESLNKKRIVTSPELVVTYKFVGSTDKPTASLEQIFDPTQTDAKLLKIMMSNPEADLIKLQGALGIEILDVQRKPKPPKPPERPKILT